MNIYIVDRWKNFGVDKHVIACSTRALAEAEIDRLKQEDEDWCDETERVIQAKTGQPYVCTRRGEYVYRIREEQVKTTSTKNMNKQTTYPFESKRDESYHKTYLANHLSLGKAVNQAGGCWERIVDQYEELLDILARNNIRVQATYTQP